VALGAALIPAIRASRSQSGVIASM